MSGASHVYKRRLENGGQLPVSISFSTELEEKLASSGLNDVCQFERCVHCGICQFERCVYCGYVLSFVVNLLMWCVDVIVLFCFFLCDVANFVGKVQLIILRSSRIIF